MNLSNEFEPIRKWAQDRNLYKQGDVMTQHVKLSEESGELAKALLDGDEAEVRDAIGDMCVVLTNLAALAAKKFGTNITIENCINGAYDEIKNRKGKMIDGTFVKDA